MTKILGLITPLTLMAGMGMVMVGYGLVNLRQENIILNFFFGIPLTLGAIGAHFLIRRVLNQNNLFIWLLESVLVGSFWFLFYYVW